MPLPRNSAGGRGTGAGGAIVARIEEGSPAARAGIQPGDRLISLNGKPVKDFLDFYLGAFEDTQVVRFERNGTTYETRIMRRAGEETGLVLEIGRPRQCTNKCIFCFIDQLPGGLRCELYVKDEDYRLSFLHGNYVTLTNLTREDEKRIVDSHLSPLYISVHSTDEKVRSSLLGVARTQPILEILDHLGRGGIRFHTQVVVVPGQNDGKALEQTIDELLTRHPYVLSLSVVPVGLTSHRNRLPVIEPLGRDRARWIVEIVRESQKRARDHTGRGIVYASDEMFELAGIPIPEADYYDDYPQLENGVGMVRIWLESLKHLKVPVEMRGKRITLVTGRLALPYISDFAERLKASGLEAEVIAVDNDLFGESITVSGLLSGRDILAALRAVDPCDAVILPPNVVNQEGLFIDDLTCTEIERAMELPIIIGSYEADLTMERINGALSGSKADDD